MDIIQYPTFIPTDRFQIRVANHSITVFHLRAVAQLQSTDA